MDFGIPTLIELPDIEDCAALCRELGLQFVEFSMSLPNFQPDTLDEGRLARVMEKYGIYYTIHLDENMNVADFNPYVVEGYFRTVRETIALAKRLGIPVLNMHLSRGVHFTLPEKKVYLFDEFRQDYLRRMAAFRDLCAGEIGEAPIRVCVENYTGFAPFQREALELLLESPVFGLTMDVGHNHCTGYVDEPVILNHRERLRHMHLHDVSGQMDHQSLGTGEVDLRKYLRLGQLCHSTVLLETKTVAGVRASARWLKDNWEGQG